MAKDYAVEVVSRYQSGPYGKAKYTTWCLSDTSKANVCAFGMEIIAGSTWREILSQRYDEEFQMKLHMPSEYSLDDVIGYDNAERFFQTRAYLMR